MMAVNLLTFDNYALPKLVVTSNITVNVSNSTIYITTQGFGSMFQASNIGTNSIYSGVSSSTFLFKGLADGSYTSITETTTNLLVNYTGITDGTSLGTNSIYSGTSSNVLQFRGVAAGSYVSINTSPNTLLVSYAGPVGNSAATSLGTNAVYSGAVNDVLQFRGVSAGSFMAVTATPSQILISRPAVSFGSISWRNLEIGANFIFTATPKEMLPANLGNIQYILLSNSTSDFVMNAVNGRLQYNGTTSGRPFLLTAISGHGNDTIWGYNFQIYVNNSPIGTPLYLVGFSPSVTTYAVLNTGDYISVYGWRNPGITLPMIQIILSAFSLA